MKSIQRRVHDKHVLIHLLVEKSTSSVDFEAHLIQIGPSLLTFHVRFSTFVKLEWRWTLDIRGYIQKHTKQIQFKNVTHWPGCSTRVLHSAKNRDAILLPVSSTCRSKPDTAKVNDTQSVKNNHLPHKQPTYFTISWALFDLFHTRTTLHKKPWRNTTSGFL